MGRRVLVFFIFMAVLGSGCPKNVAPPPSDDVVPVFPEPAAGEPGLMGSGVEIPTSHGPLDQNDKEVHRSLLKGGLAGEMLQRKHRK